VIELRNKGHEKDQILISLVNKIKEDEASSKTQAEAQKNEIEDLRKQLAEAKVKCAVAEADRDASEYWKNYLETQLQNFAHPRKDVLKNLWSA
jgi:membrane protein involved in colicin uptake